MMVHFLSPISLSAFLKFHFPEDAPAQLTERRTTFEGRIRSGQRSFQDYVIIQDESQNVIWSFTTFPDDEGTFGIQTPKYLLARTIDPKVWSESLTLVRQRLQKLNAKKASLRFSKGNITENFPAALQEMKFQKTMDRIEFKTLLKDLPNDIGTPFTWKNAADKHNLKLASEVFTQCRIGDPGADLNLNALETLQIDLKDEDLYTGPDCIQIGYIQNEAASFIFAQVDPKVGWSRITYMGLIPKYRKQGLSTWVHRHGFEMMRRQSGIEYVGGTSTENAAMLATFRKQGCQQYQIIEEWNTLFL